MSEVKRGFIESVTKFNGRIYYGVDNNDQPHDRKWLQLNKRGGHVRTGWVIVGTDRDGAIVKILWCKNKAFAYGYFTDVVPSQGIMA